MAVPEFFLATPSEWTFSSRVSLSLPPRAAACLLAVAGTFAIGSSCFAASGSWLNPGAGDNNWSTSGNWSPGVPGSTDLNVSNTDQATFQATGTAAKQPILDSSRRLGRVVIDNSLYSYNLQSTSGTNVLYLQTTGTTSAQLRIIGSGTTAIDAHVRLGGGTSAISPATWNIDSTNLTLTNGLSTGTAGSTYLRIISTGTTPVTIGGPVYANQGGTLLFVGAGSAFITGSVQDGPGGTTALSSVENYTGTIRLSGSNPFTTDTIWRAGTLEIASNAAFGASGTAAIQLGSATGGALNSTVVTTGAYTVSRHLRVSSGAINPNITIGGVHTSGTSVFSGSFAMANHAGGVNFTAAAGGTVLFSGPLTGGISSAAATKVGAGTVIFSNTGNTYVGGTTISAGTLLINNAGGSGAGTGSVVVNGGALGGTGAFTGTLTVNAGGTLTPGDSTAEVGSQAGTLATGSLIMNGGALAMNISGSNAGDGAGFYDQVIVTGTVSLVSDVNFTLTLDGYNPPDDSTVLFTLVDNNLSDPIGGSGFFNLNGTNPLTQGEIFTVGGQNFQISYTSGGTPATFQGGGNDIAILAVPEPATALLLLASAGILVSAARRRRT